MIAYKYNRKNLNQKEETFIGLIDQTRTSELVKTFNPIIDGYLNKGICHSNAYNIQEINILFPKDLATGDFLKMNFELVFTNRNGRSEEEYFYTEKELIKFINDTWNIENIKTIQDAKNEFIINEIK